ncbi:MAG: tetratricopeptide repeat protein, partial [Methanobacteriota archaeon]
MAIRHLTVKERIQLHLFDYARFADAYEAPEEVTQESIARSVGIRVPHVLQYVRPLIEEGVAESRTSHVRRKARRRKVYFLTPKGRMRAASLRTEILRETVVPFRKASGQLEQVALVRVHQEHRRGATLLDLLQELETLGSIAETPDEAPREPVDHAQEAPRVEHFYGRAKELEGVLRGVDQKPAVVVTGMAGIGKTALASKACDELRTKRPLFWRQVRPWDSALDLAFRLAAFLRALGRTELHASLIGPEAKELSQIEDRLARDLAGTRALLVLDDVHHASSDAGSFLAILLTALKRGGDAGALFVSRTVPPFYSRREVAVDGSVVEFALTGLDRESSLALLDDAGIDDPLLGSLADACAGVPLFLVLLASGKGRGRPGEIWRTIEAYISEEIEGTLDDAERGCLEAASLCQVPAPIAVVLVEPGARTKTIVGLQRKGLLTPVGRDRFILHETLRDYFAQGLSADRRTALVDRVVPQLLTVAREAEANGRPHEAIAYVGNAAFVDVDRERRLLCLRKLADLRRYVGDIPGAIEAYRTALRDVAEPAERARLLEKIAACLHVAGHFDEAERTIEEGLRLLPSEPSPEAAWLVFRRADIALTRDDYDRASEEVERLIGWMASLPEDRELWGSLANVRGSIHLDDPKRADYALAYADFQEALRAWEAAGDRRGASRAWNNLGLAALHIGRPDEALNDFDRSAAIAEAIGDVPARLKALFVKSWYLSESLGDYDAAEALYRETYKLAKETHQRERLLAHHLHFANLYRRQARFEEARESLEYYLDAARDIISEEDRIEYVSLLVRLSVAGGDVRAAESYLTEAETIDRRLSSGLSTYHVGWARGVLLAAKGDGKAADAAFQQALDHLTVGAEGEFLLDYG